jgi:hypothetical protein
MTLELVRDISDSEGRPETFSEDAYACKVCSRRIEPDWTGITPAMHDTETCARQGCVDRRAAQLASTEERYEGAQRDLATLEAALIGMLATDAGVELPHACEGAETVDVQLTESLILALSALRSVSLIARRALTEVRSGHARRAEFQQAAVIAVALAGGR